jgi:hypothetical protein
MSDVHRLGETNVRFVAAPAAELVARGDERRQLRRTRFTIHILQSGCCNSRPTYQQRTLRGSFSTSTDDACLRPRVFVRLAASVVGIVVTANAAAAAALT